MSLSEDTIISTGFKSSALIRAGSSVITVRPLTRLALAEIISAAGTENINVNLQAGRISYIDEQRGRAALPEETIMAELMPPLPVTSWAVTAPEAVNASDMPIASDLEGGEDLTTTVRF